MKNVLNKFLFKPKKKKKSTTRRWQAVYQTHPYTVCFVRRDYALSLKYLASVLEYEIRDY